ncbi:phosphosulfolactate synthase [Legionella israelensis]|uniref:phosphosulfolactate synthase n=1 Tax=Legionella israelensis TaxID=454 RepID=UPI00117E3876|nr:phosphosulfolactate synthase [Legionella israelensis]QDP72377.1 phosphosulfolactate synthase [Legionella israelensis]
MTSFNLPERTIKPRKNGLTHVLDKGLGTNAIRDLIETAGNYIDIVKLGWGTSLLVPNLPKKIELLQNAEIKVCLGGTLFEYFFLHNQVKKYENLVEKLNVDYIEISDGTISMPIAEKIKWIEHFAKKIKVFSEVGSKDLNSVRVAYKWIDEIEHALQAGAYKIIAEGRESGTAGIFHATGEVHKDLIDEVLNQIPLHHFIFEAPQTAQQIWFIRQYGSNISLGNISPNEVISLESLRLGLRGDTLLHFHKKKAFLDDMAHEN